MHHRIKQLNCCSFENGLTKFQAYLVLLVWGETQKYVPEPSKYHLTERSMVCRKWFSFLKTWQFNSKLDVLHRTNIDLTQGSATWARNGGGGADF
jgi:hypothetical protein